MTRSESIAATATPARKKRSPWTWPLIALFLLLAIVTTGALVALFTQQNNATPVETTSSAPSQTPSEEPTPVDTPSPTSNRVNLTEADVIGLTIAEARAKLGELELVATEEPGNAAESEDQVGRVYYVDPTGPVEKGTTITLRAYGPVPPPPTPETPTEAPEAPETAEPASNVTISWPAQSCPEGQTLEGYRIIVEGGGASFQGTNPTSPEATDGTVKAGTENFTVRYSYLCDGVESEASPAAEVTVEPAAE